MEAVASFPEDLTPIINEGGYMNQQVSSVDKITFSWKKTPSRTFIAREKLIPGFKASMDGRTLSIEANAADDF